MTANYYSGAATLTFTVDGAAPERGRNLKAGQDYIVHGSFMGMNKKASPKYLSVSGSGTAAINGSAVKITFSRKCDYSTASEYSFACDGIFCRKSFPMRS